MNDSASDLVRRVVDTLRRLKNALREYESTSDLQAKRDAAANVAVWGWAVTFVIQNGRNTLADFEEWYSRKVEVLAADKEFQAFKNMRTEVQKRGIQRLATVTILASSGNALLEGLMPVPEGATHAALGAEDFYGWIVRDAEGREHRSPRQWPEGIDKRQFLAFGEQGEGWGDVDRACRRYVEHLDAIVAEFVERVESSRGGSGN